MAHPFTIAALTATALVALVLVVDSAPEPQQSREKPPARAPAAAWVESTDLHPSEAAALADTVRLFEYPCPKVIQAWVKTRPKSDGDWLVKALGVGPGGEAVANCGGPENLYRVYENSRGRWYAEPFKERCLNSTC